MRRRLPLASAAVLTTAACAVALLITSFVACGISGCSGGGFGPAYDPEGTQIGILVTGLLLVPLALLVVPGPSRYVVAPAAALAGIVATMLALGLGPNGCPIGLERAPEARGGLTCTAAR